jgi:16S rRNA (cytidine1402-2'-O)-methyltransferase
MAFMSGTLYLVATPIGNLEDITYRAVRVLGAVDIVACEDTRHTRKLLNHYNIQARTLSYHEHNEHSRAAELCAELLAGKSVAVVSDAGAPGINDPGFRLVRLCAESGVRVSCLPGPVALVAALTVSGLPTDNFYFGGFLPAKKNARRAALNAVRELPATLVFYETPHRIAHALTDAREVLGERAAVVARELTKLHEEIARGPLSELAQLFSAPEKARGEMVLLIDRASADTGNREESAESRLAARVSELEQEGLAPREALKRAAREAGLKRDAAYRLLAGQN